MLATAIALGFASPAQGEPAAPQGGPAAAEAAQAAELAEADRLTAEVERLAGEDRAAEAVPLARRALALREKALGPDHLSVGLAANNLAYLLKATGDLAGAELLYRRALAIREKALGPEHVQLVVPLNNLAAVLRARGDPATAEAAYQRALAILERALGPNHPNVGIILGNYAAMQRDRGDLASAAQLYRRLVALNQKNLGPDDAEALEAQVTLAHVLMEQGDLAGAEPLLRDALLRREKALAADHPDVVDLVCDLASVLQDRDKLVESEPFYRRALTALQAKLGRDHGTVAALLNNFALLLKDLGRYDEAEQLYRRALAIREKQLGPDHVEVALVLRNLAILLHAQGDLAAAEPPLRRALAIHTKRHGPEHATVAQVLASLASLLHDKGDLAGAEPLYRQALAMREKLRGAEHLEVADSLNDLASLLQDLRDLAGAKPLYRRALAIREKLLGAADARVAHSLNNLALLLKQAGDLAEAEVLYRRALRTLEAARGPDHPDTALPINNLANLLQATGRLDEAGSLHRRALAIRERTLGPQHPLVASSLQNLATLLEARGDARGSAPLRLRALSIEERQLAGLLLIGSEQQKLNYAATLVGSTYAAVSLAVAHPELPAAVRAGLTAVLQRKGRVLDALVQTGEVLRHRGNPDEQGLLADLLAARAALAARYARGPAAGQPQQFLTEIEELQRKVEGVERALASASPQAGAALLPVELARIQAALPHHAVLVEFLRYQPFHPAAHTAEDRWQAPRYAAFVLGRRGDPLAVDLGPALAIDTAAEAARRSLAASHDSAAATLRKLDALVLAPLRPKLPKAGLVLVSPDGALHTVPLEALVDERGNYAIERLALHDLSSGRDLLRAVGSGPQAQAPLLLADPDFEAAAEPGSATETGAAPAAGVAALRWTRLAGTAQEAAAIAPLLPGVRMLLGRAATEAALKSARAPAILHIATHGFFLEDAPATGTAGSRGAQLMGDDLGDGPRPHAVPVAAQAGGHPLLRSGLVLAGIGAGGKGANDGALTALEVTALDLWGTALVVLSACSTGRGEVQNGEGVFGLRRAFAMAGAQSLVLSLWDVDDDATRALMVSFYKNLQAGGSRAEALRAAKRSLLATPQWAHPNYWAAFIGSGAWGPLAGMEPPAARRP
ncbi:MAG: tetratricopeptide repeat protein [Deltaproteobacteria bacterium]|nr:tetratricopeptide repeat protein [Deltaproteobacteria bacterium]